MSTIRLKHWVGGLGNNLEQIAFALWLAESSNGQFICDVNHPILSVPKNIKYGNKLEPTINGCFGGMAFLKNKSDISNERFKNLHLRLQKIAPILFKKIAIQNFDGIVIHIRAGNIYKNPSCGKYMVQAPINFFEKVVTELNFKKNALIVTNPKFGKEGKLYHNPSTPAIKKYCDINNLKCYIHQGDVKEAIGYLLYAQNAVITGYTTFSRYILLANKNLKNVAIPNMSNWPHDEISFKLHQCNAHNFTINNYMKEWNVKCKRMQVKYDINNIEYNGVL